MMSSWWVLWMVFMFVFLLAPLGYGWGYRSWGPPYPSYIQRRRHAAAMSANSSFNYRAWGIGGDVVWIVVMIAAFSLFVVIRWH